jgi:hypothetical protein
MELSGKGDKLSGFTGKENFVSIYHLLNFRRQRVKGTIFRRDGGPQYTWVLPFAPQAVTLGSLQVAV